MAVQDWEAIGKEKRAQAAEKIPKAWRLDAKYTANISETASNNVLGVPGECGLLTSKQLDITENYDATALLEKLHSGAFSAFEVTEAFCIRAAIAQQVTNCLTETFFEQALERARHLDEIFKEKGKRTGPFHGLPVSLKDCFNVKGIASTIGFTSFVKHGPTTSNSAMVQVLLDLGAIPYVKTNIPQTMMAGDSHNYVFGRTLNPHKSNLSAGGSSGGEGALIAMRGSVLGVGTDIAGSVRIPSFCNGVFGLRPSENRLPYGGQTSPARAGLAGILPVAGPLATSVRDLQLFASLVVNEDPWKYDSACIFSTWRVVEPREKLRLGFILEDPHFPVHPPIVKTLTRAVEALKAAGHEVVELTPPSIREACLLAFRLFAMDPAGTAFKHIQASGEPTIPALATTTLPHEYMPEEYAPLTLEGLYDLQAQREEYKEKYRLMMLEAGIETLIMPAYQTTAPEHDMVGLVPYTVLNNVVDYPAMIIPYGKANKEEDAEYIRDVDYKPPYNPDAVDGAPCAVQLVSRNMREEELLRDAEVIARVLGY